MMSEGTNLALGKIDKIEERKQPYRNNGIDYYRPGLFLITDGLPTEPPEVVQAASERLKQAATDTLKAFLSSPKVTARADDDLTLLLVTMPE
jgi:uncharacterized protein YegL